ESIEHHVERGLFLRDEEHGLAASQSACNQIRNGLRLPGPGRPLDHQMMPALDGSQGAKLCGIRVHHLRCPLRREAVVEHQPGDGMSNKGAARALSELSSSKNRRNPAARNSVSTPCSSCVRRAVSARRRKLVERTGAASRVSRKLSVCCCRVAVSMAASNASTS